MVVPLQSLNSDHWLFTTSHVLSWCRGIFVSVAYSRREHRACRCSFFSRFSTCACCLVLVLALTSANLKSTFSFGPASKSANCNLYPQLAISTPSSLSLPPTSHIYLPSSGSFELPFNNFQCAWFKKLTLFQWQIWTAWFVYLLLIIIKWKIVWWRGLLRKKSSEAFELNLV